MFQTAPQDRKAVGGIENNGGVFQMGSSILADDTGEDFSGVLGSLGYNLILNTSGTGIYRSRYG